MSHHLQRIILAFAVFGLAVGCATGVIGGKPQLPLSDKRGTARIVAAAKTQTILAITNAFAEFSYRGMALHIGVESEETLPSIKAMNSFELRAMHEPIAKVPLDIARTKWVPYIADFQITLKPLNSNQTKIIVQTLYSEVLDGKEPGVHTEWANHYRSVPPVRQEEENVLAAIEKALESPEKVGR